MLKNDNSLFKDLSSLFILFNLLFYHIDNTLFITFSKNSKQKKLKMDRKNNKKIETFLIELIKSACLDIWKIIPNDIQIENTPKEFEGDYTLVTFSLSKVIKESPDHIGNKIGKWICEKNNDISTFNIVKGFLNITLSDKIWLDQVHIMNDKDFFKFESNDKKVLVEFSSPNTNKPLHLGHLRNNFIGQTILRLLNFVGFSAHGICVVNDRGIHICKSMVAYKKYGKNETPESTNMKGDKFVGSYYILFDKKDREQIAEGKVVNSEDIQKKSLIMQEAQDMLLLWENGDAETIDLWKKMNSWVYSGFDVTYKKIGVSFEKIYYESQTYLLGKKVVQEGLDKGVFYKKEDGSSWIDLSDKKLDQKILIRSDGTSVYMTQDIGMADLRYSEFCFDRSIYVVGNEQDYHFNVLFEILKKLKRPYAENLYHLSYGMVDLPSGKMKSREGTVVDADDLIKEVEELAEDHTKRLGKVEGLSKSEAEELYHILALGALKYQILKVDSKKRIMFNPEESVDFQGNTGPFVQYTHARITSVLDRSKDLKIDLEDLSDIQNICLDILERNLIKNLYLFKQRIEEAADQLSQSLIIQYIFDLCRCYNRFYAELSIIQEHDLKKLKMRLILSKLTKQIIKNSMYLLGIDVPNRM